MAEAVQVIQERLASLETKRIDLKAQLEREILQALQPIDSSIKELRHVLSMLDGGAVGAPAYSLTRKARPSPSQVPEVAGQGFQPVTQSAVPGDAEALPPPKMVLSPKSKTPVLTNEGALRAAIKKRTN